ncbi:MAG: tRNA-specific 2-thiouridylase [Clostridia bacterium]|nr:tRNA-specific 2-thiouridylase [Clostridia bacterium]
MDKKTVVVGFSGGVDSAVTALLLKEQGYDVRCLHLTSAAMYCCEDNIEAAKRSTDELGLELSIFNRDDLFVRDVCEPFADDYINGETPNPCVRCNKNFKFAALYEYCRLRKLDAIATGHYAANRFCAEANTNLFFSVESNDQSYMLSRVRPRPEILFPLAGMSKAEVVAYAASRGLSSAERPSSMEICFASPQGGQVEAVEKFAPYEELRFTRGCFVLPDGRRIPHKGTYHYSIGQKSGLGIAVGRKLTVVDIDPDSGDVILADEAPLASAIRVYDFRSYAPFRPDETLKLRLRHSKDFVEGRVEPDGEGEAVIRFTTPVLNPCQGQEAVVYKDYAEGRAVVAVGRIMREGKEFV